MGVPFTVSAKMRKFAQQVVGCVIPPGCTDLVQIGDTDLHTRGKDAALQEKIKLQGEANLMRDFKCEGASVVQNLPRDIMRVAVAFADEIKKAVDENVVVKGLRTSGYLSFVPGPNGKLVDVDQFG